MKSKIVIRGSNAQDEKCLIAIALRPESNKVDIWTFPESVATEDFYQKMMKEWRDGDGMELPEPSSHIERELTLTDNLLPDDLKAERGDVIQRAQTEWHFIVLSSKLHEAYKEQLADLKEKVEKLQTYEQSTWDSLKEFWDRLQEQVRERNIFRGHADVLRDNANALFVKMKELRTNMDHEFDRISQETADKFYAALNEVEKKMETGARVPVLFDELKKIQRKYRDAKLTREHRDKVWEKIDGAFKAIKEKRFGVKPGSTDDSGSVIDRLQRRYDGLVSAIDKMEQSIKRDRHDLDFQQHKIDTTDGQLEAQIRQAKIVMIDERVRSKGEKLAEMITTKADLDKRLAVLRDKEARRAAQVAAKQKIAGSIKTAAATRQEDGTSPEAADVEHHADQAVEDATDETLDLVAEAPLAEALPTEAAEVPTEAAADEEPISEPKEESLFSAVSATLGESLEDVMDTFKAVASVIGDKIEEAVENLKEELEKATEPAEAAAPAEAPAEEAPVAVAAEPAAAVAAEEAAPVAEAVVEEAAAAEVEEVVADAVAEVEGKLEEEK